jgi:hypothetical protein
MKVKLTRQVADGGQVTWPGQEVELSEDLARHYAEQGWVEGVAPAAVDKPVAPTKRGPGRPRAS